MQKLEKKLIALLVAVGFLTVGLTTTSAVNIGNNKINDPEETSPEISIQLVTITLYRYGPDGLVTPIKVELELEEGQDMVDAIVAKCDELLENDEEIQQLVDRATNKSIFGLFCRVTSSGAGFHYKTMLLEKLYIRYLLWKLNLPRIAPFIAKPFVFCRYKSDDEAKTIITPILGNKTDSREIEGTHSVFVNSFIGIAGWIGRFSYTLLTKRAFSGYGRIAFCNKLQ